MKTSTLSKAFLLAASFCLGSGIASGQNVFTRTGDLLQQRAAHTATLLPDGTVLVTGGWIHFYTIASAELYDPTTEKWSSTDSLQTPRDHHTATLLRNGKVLVVGGMNLTKSKPRQRIVHASAELYDPASKTWSAAENMQTERAGHTATLLPDGRVLVVGGLSQRHNAAINPEIYDPTTGKWSSTSVLIRK